jgi:S-adenosylmethionine decarboxylase
MNKRGLHLIGDLYDCDFSDFVLTEEALSSLKVDLLELLKQNEITPLGSVFHFFGPSAVTATICLAESHLSFHTWPEDKYVSLDVFICNHTKDNTGAAEVIFKNLCEKLFKSGRIIERRLDR